MAKNRCNVFNIVSLAFFALHGYCNAENEGKLQGMFSFGTSVVDNGNNNYLSGSLAKVNYTPYGIDFPTGPTGRFSNGKNIADFLAELLSLPPIPAFSDPRTDKGAVVHGVNYGSGGSGILKETGSIAGNVTSLSEQIGNFERVTVPQLEAQLGSQRENFLPNYLFLVAEGNNDYLLNYFLQKIKTLTPQAFAEKLVSTYSDQLKRLYNLGARKFVLISVYPLGCSPVVSKGIGCLPLPNAAVTMFYKHLISMVDQVKPQMPGSDIVVVNPIKIITDIISKAGPGFSYVHSPCCELDQLKPQMPVSDIVNVNPGKIITDIISKADFSDVNSSCCELSENGASCLPNGKVCENRNNYVYFDGQHNTEALNAFLAAKAYTSHDLCEVYPVNLHRLVHANQ